MVSGTKIERGSSTELRLWGAGTDELLELLEEEVLEDILNQVKTLKILKKLEKNKKQDAREKSNRQRRKNGRKTIRKKKGGSSGTNLGWSEGCRDAEMGTTRRTPKAKKDIGEERNS